jgi:hypothetical protein
MKHLIILAALICSSVFAKAQKHEMPFPFQGGKEAMVQFFNNNVTIPNDVISKRATGTAVFKFTADIKGNIQKIIVYYADDYLLTLPFIDALKKSDRKWIILDQEKVHDFIIYFTLNINLPEGKANPDLQKAMYKYYQQRKPILAFNPVPLDMATLLPAVTVTYNVTP